MSDENLSEAAQPENSISRDGTPVEIYASGMNGALNRVPRVREVLVPLISPTTVAARWRPAWGKLKTIGLTFPAGMDFLPPPKPKPEAAENPASAAPGGE